MKKTLLIAGAMLTLSAALALAAPGTRIAWNDCGGPKNMTSTCASNFETQKVLQGSYELPPPGATVTGNEIILDAADPTGAPLSCWWNMVSTNAPRAAGWDMIFTNPVNCADYWGSIPGGPTGGSGASSSGNRVRFGGIVAISESGAQPIPDGVEFYSFSWRLKFANTTGGTCPGCNTPNMQINLQDINVTQPTGGGPSIHLGPDPTVVQQCAKFNTAITSCDAATPTKNSTWGQVKALYR